MGAIMKKMIKLLTIIFGLCLVFVSVFSCEGIVALGEKLDIEGPILTITNPPPRKPVNITFTLEGTVTDFTGVDILLVKVVILNQELARQWRYKDNAWHISDNNGESWAAYTSANNSWSGSSKNADWKLDVNLPIGAQDGEYTVIAQAWDVGGFSDENSYKSVVVIVDNDLPKINITDPYLYYEYSTPDRMPTNGEFIILNGYGNVDAALYDPANIGKFITRGFNLQYQIDDGSDVWSIEIRLYDTADGIIIDEDPETPMPSGYVMKFNDNIGPPPSEPSPENNIKPSGTVKVPALNSTAPEIAKQVTVKSAIMVVGLCYDAAGNLNQEKILGYFLYWPNADKPWITFSQGMEETYGNKNEVYMVYPGREIKAIAFQAHGVTKVEYNIYKHLDWNTPIDELIRTGSMDNAPRFGNVYSTIFPWQFLPPSSTGYYSIRAKAYGDGGVESDSYNVLFYVQDVSFPDFPEPPSPSASLPLFHSIGEADSFGNPTAPNRIRVHGIVSDATAVDSLFLVWINPESREFAAMSQLQYFRDAEYTGWRKADLLAEGAFAEEGEYDSSHPNKVWKVPKVHIGKDMITGRELYQYSQEIDITTHLNIAGAFPRDQPLRSQVFLLRAKNPDSKYTIITYAPQGDEAPPFIPVQNEAGKDFQIKVSITGDNAKTCYSGHYELIEQFNTSNEVIVEGQWFEDSIEYLNFETYLRNNFEITINGYKIDGLDNTTLSFTPASGKGFTTGTWRATAKMGSGAGYKLLADNIKDTLVVAVKLKDIGGNITEAGGSWLIRSDTLRLLRISSEMADTKYNADSTGDKNLIKIFLEFNKPVALTYGGFPELQLNVTGGTAASTRARYSSGQNTQSTKQYFEYRVTDGHGTADPVLDVTGLVNVSGLNYWQTLGYSFTWHTGSGADREEIRITLPTETAHIGNKVPPNDYYLRRLPVYSNASDQVYSLRGGKQIEIDTTPPGVLSIISTNPAGFYPNGTDIFIDVKFNEPIKITSTTPTLALQLRDAANNPRTVNTNGTPKVNGDTISFTYKVAPSDTTAGNPIIVTNFSGGITDIAGNALPGTAISGLAVTARTLNGTADSQIRGIEANTPGTPVVKILSAATNTYGDNTANVIQNTVNNTNMNGFSQGAPFDMLTLYHANLWMAIDGNITGSPGGAHKLTALEYSTNDGIDWIRAPSIAGNYYVMALPRLGKYEITARQIDRAGNISGESQTITINWDKDPLVTLITSTSSNGTYSDKTIPSSVNITVHFRKPLFFETTPTLVLNARRGAAAINLTADGTQAGTSKSSLTYTYTILQGDNIPGNANLDVTGFAGTFTITDGGSANTGVNVTNYITMPPAGDARLGTNKEIKVDTSALNVVNAPTFTGAVQADGSWAGSMSMTFNKTAISKGSGNIRFEQTAGTNYRLPAVLTEAQYNRLRTVPYINTFYKRGTNGYLVSTQASDTSTKYILAYEHDTAVITPNSGAADGTIAKFADEMRMAEAIEIPVNAQAVTITGNTLTVQLTGSNSLQVPGAEYKVSIGTIVQDAIGNQILATDYNASTTGVAKPFVRIRKTQDTITAQGGSNTAPIYAAVQPMTSLARMDCRTPGSVVIYRYQYTVTAVTSRNWGGGDNTATANANGTGDLLPPQDSLTTGNPDPNLLGNPRTDVTANGNTTAAYAAPITLPIPGDGVADYQGYQWLVRAVGRTGPAGSYVYGADYEEIAYRTVLTYQVNNMGNTGTYGYNLSTTPTTGAQVWIRGGDAIGSSTTPGFPLTWADDWNALSGKRAGIRLMTMQTVGANLSTSTWKWVSWEVNVPAYFDMIKGNNITNAGGNITDANIAWQFGPSQWAYQRDGWTSYKEQYPMFPGKHRWMFVNANTAFNPKGSVNFSATYASRRTITAVEGWTTPNNVNPVPTPVVE
jgi:hypothetical protein